MEFAFLSDGFVELAAGCELHDEVDVVGGGEHAVEFADVGVVQAGLDLYLAD